MSGLEQNSNHKNERVSIFAQTVMERLQDPSKLFDITKITKQVEGSRVETTLLLIKLVGEDDAPKQSFIVSYKRGEDGVIKTLDAVKELNLKDPIKEIQIQTKALDGNNDEIREKEFSYTLSC